MRSKIPVVSLIAALGVVFVLSEIGIANTKRPRLDPATYRYSFFLRNPPNVHSHHGTNLFSLSVALDPGTLFSDSDARLRISVERVDDSYKDKIATVRLSSDSLHISPNEERRLELRRDEFLDYVITPIGIGQKKLHVYAKSDPQETFGEGFLSQPIPFPPVEDEHIIDIPIVARPDFLGLSQKVFTTLQLVSVAIGLPSILLLVVTKKYERNLKRKRDRPSIILP